MRERAGKTHSFVKVDLTVFGLVDSSHIIIILNCFSSSSGFFYTVSLLPRNRETKSASKKKFTKINWLKANEPKIQFCKIINLLNDQFTKLVITNFFPITYFQNLQQFMLLELFQQTCRIFLNLVSQRPCYIQSHQISQKNSTYKRALYMYTLD